MRGKKLLAACLGVLMLSGSLPSAAALSQQERQDDLDFLLKTLEENHADFYHNTTKEAVAQKKAEIESNLAESSDLDFAIELSELAAMAGDSHTSISIGGAISGLRLLPFDPEWYDGKWTLAGAPAQYSDAIGSEITAINGHSMETISQALEPMVNYDNESYLRRSVGNLIYIFDVLVHYGLAQGDEPTLPLTVHDASGKETVLDIPVYTQEEYKAMPDDAFINARKLRKQVPITEPDQVNYKLLDLDDGMLYMQYNTCMEDEDLPMEQFAAEVKEKLNSGAYDQFVIDLRNNGGGSDAVLYPITYLAQQFMAEGNTVYALAGESTFSSALINTVQLKNIGAVVVGGPTGGSVDHFGEISWFELPNSKISGRYSNKFIDLSSYYEAAAPYGVESFPPDIEAEQTFEDYINGIDTAIYYLKTHERVKPETQAEARVSQARVTVDGKPVEIGAYTIAGSNYFKLRDLAMAFIGAEGGSFNVTWDNDAKKVTISEGVYTPVGGELEPLSGGTQTARLARADMSAYSTSYEMEMPIVGKTYEIAGNHYFKLRDLCQILNIHVGWDAQTKTIVLDSTKAYLAE